MRAELDEARERYFWQIVLRLLGTAAIVMSALGLLAWLTLVLGWSRHPLPCAIGLVAGAATAMAGTASSRGRERTALVLGAITLPALAAHLAAAGARSEEAVGAYSARLVPFLVHAAVALLGGVGVAALWRGRARAARRGAEAAGVSEPEAGTGLARAPEPPPQERSIRSGRAERPSVEGAAP